jgi:hypothetical protein
MGLLENGDAIKYALEVLAVCLVGLAVTFILGFWIKVVFLSLRSAAAVVSRKGTNLKIAQHKIDQLQREIESNMKEMENLKKSWKPDEGIYCSCTFEDNHNPALLTECEYHENIRRALVIVYQALKGAHYHSNRVLKEDCSYRVEGFKWIEDLCASAMEAVKDVVNAAQAPMTIPKVECNCEICQDHSDENKTIKQRFIPAVLCLNCSRKDLVVTEDLHPRESA